MPDYQYTDKQGQYLAFIYNYTVIHGQPPAEADMQRFFRVSPPTIHQMVLRLEERGLISREPGKPRTIWVLVPPDQLPYLKDPTFRSHGMRQVTSPDEGLIYQIKVALKGSKPPIWRRLLVPSDVALDKLHVIIQEAMGWYDAHLHQFIVGGDTHYGEPHSDYFGFQMLDERRYRLNQIAPGEQSKFVYEYDFGDGWEHVVLVEKVLPWDPEQTYPVCIKGRRACPPEDVGGIWMYNFHIESMRNPEHPDYPGVSEFLEWLGEDFDPEEFDLDSVNQALNRL
jgi:hypothetical protein